MMKCLMYILEMNQNTSAFWVKNLKVYYFLFGKQILSQC